MSRCRFSSRSDKEKRNKSVVKGVLARLYFSVIAPNRPYELKGIKYFFHTKGVNWVQKKWRTEKSIFNHYAIQPCNF